MKTIIAAAVAIATLATASAEVSTYQGSTRWNATLFTPNVRTAFATSSYTTYFIVETFGDDIVNAVKIDVWTTRTGRFYAVDNNFSFEYGFFGFAGIDVGGAMETDDFDVKIAFRGIQRFGDLDSFTLYPAVDYFPRNAVLDITTITGSARYNRFFSGDFTLNQIANEIIDMLESRGFREF